MCLTVTVVASAEARTPSRSRAVNAPHPSGIATHVLRSSCYAIARTWPSMVVRARDYAYGTCAACGENDEAEDGSRQSRMEERMDTATSTCIVARHASRADAATAATVYLAAVRRGYRKFSLLWLPCSMACALHVGRARPTGTTHRRAAWCAEQIGVFVSR